MYKKSPDGGRLCVFMPLPSIKRAMNIPHPRDSYRTQPIEPNRTIELDECFKDHTFALKFLRYVRAVEPKEEAPPVVEETPENVVVEAPEALPVDTEDLSPGATQESRVDELQNIANQLDPFTKDPGFAALDRMTAIDLAKFINSERGLYAKVQRKNSKASDFPTKAEWVSIARFGYTKDEDAETGQLSTWNWASRWFTKSGGKLQDLYKANRSRQWDGRKSAADLQDFAYSKGWFSLPPYELTTADGEE